MTRAESEIRARDMMAASALCGLLMVPGALLVSIARRMAADWVEALIAVVLIGPPAAAFVWLHVVEFLDWRARRRSH